METLAVDGSTLPGLKDLFPEHFHEHPEQAMQSQQQGAILPQVSGTTVQQLQLTHPQQPQNVTLQQQDVEYSVSNGATNFAYAHQPPTKVSGGRRSNKRAYEAAHTQLPSHPQPMDPYYYPGGPNIASHQFPESSDVHSQIPGVSGQAREGMAEPEVDEDADGSPDGEKRRHPCPRCGKRFNRPSSLKIHLNTHTGAKPYVCPFQGCGRTFNVSSNMRRHFRNHARRPLPPPLPQHNIYPFPSSQAPNQQDQREHGTAAQNNPLPQQQPLSLPEMYDTGSLRGEFPDYSTHFYPPSSDVRNNKPRGEQHLGEGALITPPYTNEGDDQDLDSEIQKNFFPPMAPYSSFTPDHGQSGSSSMHDPSRMAAQHIIPGTQVPVGMHFEMSRIAPSTFPVDPTLVDRNVNDDPDADGELDPDIDGRGDNGVTEGGEVRRFGPSTSNTRASSSRPDPRPGERQNNDAPNMTNVFLPGPPTHYPPRANGGLYRPSPLPGHVSAIPLSQQNAQYSQQYQAQYSQQAHPYHQQQALSIEGVGRIYADDAQYSAQTQFPHASYSGSIQYPPYQGQPQQYSQTIVNGHPAYCTSDGVTANQARQQSYIDGGSHPESSYPKFGPGQHRNNPNVANSGTLRKPSAAVALSRPLLPYSTPGTYPGSDRKTKTAGEVCNEQDANWGYGDREDGGSDEGSNNGDDDDDDDEYTGRPAPKKGKQGKRANGTRGRGRPRGRPKNSVGSSTRGRGRPRKSAPAAILSERRKGEETEEAASRAGENTDSPDGVEVGGRVLRKRRRVSAR